jgi:hypothetical protein
MTKLRVLVLCFPYFTIMSFFWFILKCKSKLGSLLVLFDVVHNLIGLEDYAS